MSEYGDWLKLKKLWTFTERGAAVLTEIFIHRTGWQG